MSEHERWADAAAAYLLEAMPQDERRAYEAHLEGCRTCREEVDALRPAAESLPVGSPPMTPPPALKARIMTAVEREAELLRAAGPGADRPPAPARRGRRFALPRLALVAAALLVAVVAGVALDRAPHTAPLTVDREQAPAASGELRMTGDRAELVVTGLPEPPKGRVYQVWVRHEGAAAPAPTDTLFMPRSDGSAVAAVPAMEDVEAVLVTQEPAGGSATPTRAPLLSASPS